MSEWTDESCAESLRKMATVLLEWSREVGSMMIRVKDTNCSEEDLARLALKFARAAQAADLCAAYLESDEDEEEGEEECEEEDPPPPKKTRKCIRHRQKP